MWVAMAILALTPFAPTASGAFRTPSANVVCGWSAGRGAPSVECGIKSGLRPAPPPPAGGCSAGDYTAKRVSLRATGRSVPVVCAGDPGPFLDEAKATVLAYGEVWQHAGIWCISQQAGLTCGNRSGHGFFLSRSRWRAF
jgi:hypothetical protein